MDKKNQPDLVLFLITLVLLIIGLIMVLSASSYEAMLDYDDALHFFKRQAAFMAMGFIPMFIMMNINIDFVKRLAFPGLLYPSFCCCCCRYLGWMSMVLCDGIVSGRFSLGLRKWQNPL